MMRVAIGVMAGAPLPGRCKRRLLTTHEGSWVAGLYAAMLRDTLDGLQMVEAIDYVVFAAPVPPAPGEEEDEECRAKTAVDVLARHVPSPWRLVSQREGPLGTRVERALAVLLERADLALLAGSDSPSFPTEPLVAALAELGAREGASREQAIIGPSESGGAYLFGTTKVAEGAFREAAWGTPALRDTMRVRCKDLGLPLHELPNWYRVAEPSDVLTLLDEMRTSPDRAPRTAQFLVTRA